MYHASIFARFAKWVSKSAGHPLVFALALASIFLWLATGPLFGFSDTWQLIVNTSTTIITFLMVFLLQHTQNRDSRAIQIKLDELIRTTKGAHNALLDLEELRDKELEIITSEYRTLALKARDDIKRGLKDTDVPEVNNESNQ